MLSNITKSKSIIPTSVEFVDIAGLVKGASKGEGLGNQFLANIRECDSIVQARIHSPICLLVAGLTEVRARPVLRCLLTLSCMRACLVARPSSLAGSHCLRDDAGQEALSALCDVAVPHLPCPVCQTRAHDGSNKCKPANMRLAAHVVRCLENESMICVAGKVDQRDD